MSALIPLYTRENTAFACPLQWGLTIFWRAPPASDVWFAALALALESDGIRLLGHQFVEDRVSQFAVSTKPEVPPLLIVQRTKGRLQHLVREQFPKALQANYALRSFGKVTREVVEHYVAGQVDHHPMVDARVVERLKACQILNENVHLGKPQRTSQGLFWHNLHIVLVHRDRWRVVDEEILNRVSKMIADASQAKNYLLSRAGILPDHVHLTLGCPIDVAPVDVALGFLNNLAYVHGMKPVFQYGGFISTFGEYGSGAVQSETRLRPNAAGSKPTLRRGELGGGE